MDHARAGSSHVDPQATRTFRESIELDPVHWAQATVDVLGKALQRLWGRDVMLYVGGVSFWIMLAVFPLLVIAVGLYGILVTPEQVASQAAALARMLPADARDLFQGELQRLAHAPHVAVSAQSLVALDDRRIRLASWLQGAAGRSVLHP
jgi:membrane protein